MPSKRDGWRIAVRCFNRSSTSNEVDSGSVLLCFPHVLCIRTNSKADMVDRVNVAASMGGRFPFLQQGLLSVYRRSAGLS